MRFFRTLCVLLLVHTQWAWAGIELELKSEAVLSDRQIRLSDVATVRGTANASAIGSRVIGPAPRIGQVGYLRRSDIDIALRARTGSIEKIVWSGAPVVAMRSAVQSVAGRLLSEAAIAHVRQQLEPRYPALEVRLDSELADVDVRPGTYSIAVRPMREAQPRSRESVWVDIVDGDRVERSVVVALRISLPAQASFAIRDLPAGHAIARSDIELREVDLATAGSGAAPSDNIEGARARSAIKAGELIKGRSVVAHGSVMRGDVVKVSLQAGAVRIAASGVAQDDARLEERIKIRLAGGTMLDGRVIADGTVVIE